MLNSVLKDAIKKRDETLSILKGPTFEKIVSQAKSNWVDFSPTKQDVVAAGIDSSFNSTKFQGAELWAVTAVSVKSDGEILVDLHEHGLDSSKELSSLASKMEVDACIESVDMTELVLMDGSIHSHFLKRQKPLTTSLVNAITKKNNVVFISKTSNTKKQFEDLGAIAGDIFYYNHATVTPGFSKIHEEQDLVHSSKAPVISSVFARLAESLPLIKIELLGSGYTDNDFKLILNKILKNSIGGYPYALKLAHNNCTISGKDLAKLAGIHGLSNEIGSREILG